MFTTIKFSAIQWLSHPIVELEFIRQHYERSVFHAARGSPDYYAQTLSLGDIDSLLTLSSDALDKCFAIKQGHASQPFDALINSSNAFAKSRSAHKRVTSRLQNGYSLVLNGIHDFFPSVQRLVSQVELELCARVQANLYISPRGAQGLSKHFDFHDAFILQVHGRKQWRLYEKIAHNPDPNMPGIQAKLKQASGAKLTQELTLEQGDMLYIPRGVVHDAYTNNKDSLSAHITLGVTPPKIKDIFRLLKAESYKTDFFKQSIDMALQEHVSLTQLEQQFKDELMALVDSFSLKQWLEKLRVDFKEAYSTSCPQTALSDYDKNLSDV